MAGAPCIITKLPGWGGAPCMIRRQLGVRTGASCECWELWKKEEEKYSARTSTRAHVPGVRQRPPKGGEGSTRAWRQGLLQSSLEARKDALKPGGEDVYPQARRRGRLQHHYLSCVSLSEPVVLLMALFTFSGAISTHECPRDDMLGPE